MRKIDNTDYDFIRKIERTDYTLKEIEDIFSAPRIAEYYSKAEGKLNIDQIVAIYNANITLSEAMIPILHYFEITLRNKLNKMIATYFGDNWLIRLPEPLMISQYDIKKIEKIVQKIRREKQKSATHDDILSQMNLGFWCAFFEKRYEQILWNRKEIFKIVFPDLLKQNRSRKYIEARIIRIKFLRNQVAHHELILNGSMIGVYNYCIELLMAMSYQAYEYSFKIDRFMDVYEHHIIDRKLDEELTYV